MSLCRQIATWEGYLEHMTKRMLTLNPHYVNAFTLEYNTVASRNSFSEITTEEAASALVQGALLYPIDGKGNYLPLNACRVLYGIDEYETGVGGVVDTDFRRLSDNLVFTTYRKICTLF